MHGYSIQGALSARYISPQHVETLWNEPELTSGMNFGRGSAFQCSEFYFALSAIDDGRGLIAHNYTGTVMVWRGNMLHGTVVGPSTRDALLSTLKRDDPYASLGIAAYQKKRPLLHGAKRYSGWPETYKMAGNQIYREYIEGTHS